MLYEHWVQQWEWSLYLTVHLSKWGHKSRDGNNKKAWEPGAVPTIMFWLILLSKESGLKNHCHLHLPNRYIGLFWFYFLSLFFKVFFTVFISEDMCSCFLYWLTRSKEIIPTCRQRIYGSVCRYLCGVLYCNLFGSMYYM